VGAAAFFKRFELVRGCHDDLLCTLTTCPGANESSVLKSLQRLPAVGEDRGGLSPKV
jgi:hypothetical protein